MVMIFNGCFSLDMPGQSFRGPRPPLDATQALVRERMENHVRSLAGSIGERNMWRPGTLAGAAGYIESVLAQSGYRVARQSLEADGEKADNLEAVLPGKARPGEIIVVGAHYDTVPGSPGADDNASGVAGLLELARLLAGKAAERTIRFVAFANEEPPYYLSEGMGSRIYARRCRGRGEKILAMYSLETIGCFLDEPGSQRYPFPFGLAYPDTGNFIAFVANPASAGLVRESVRLFRDVATLPSEGAALPDWVTGVGWSDQWSFWQEGYPGIMVTDTAFFRYRHYHTPEDTPDKLDYERMARVVTGLAEVVIRLASSASR